MFKFSNKGFTIGELLIVIAIIVVLALIAFPIYKGYAGKALKSEGKALVVSIQNAENKYFAKFGQYYDGKNIETSYDATLDIDARNNKNFKTFKTSADNSGKEYTVTVIGSDKADGIVLTETEKK